MKKIFLGGEEIEPVIDQFLACEKIVSTSLHGLIIADAYGIPNAWLESKTPKGLEFKYWDYLLSVDKVRQPQAFRLLAKDLTVNDLLDNLDFDGRELSIDLDKLRQARPF